MKNCIPVPIKNAGTSLCYKKIEKISNEATGMYEAWCNGEQERQGLT